MCAEDANELVLVRRELSDRVDPQVAIRWVRRHTGDHSGIGLGFVEMERILQQRPDHQLVDVVRVREYVAHAVFGLVLTPFVGAKFLSRPGRTDQ